MSRPKTSWGKVARWYDELLGSKDSYQKSLILPNLLRLIEIKRGETLLDLGCGQGFFSREFANAGAKVIGIDISPELIELAEKHKSSTFFSQSIDPAPNRCWIDSRKKKHNDANPLVKSSEPEVPQTEGPSSFEKMLDKEESVEYHVAQAENLTFLKNETVDKVTIILTLQNIENVSGVINECARVIKPNGKIFIVLNHPAFRIPKRSSWGFDETKKIQYRRIDGYLSESKEQIQMHPGDKPWEKTISFHRPLQFYFKTLKNHGFCVTNLEEWNSPKKSEPGPKSNAEDIARREIPLFLFLQCLKFA